MRAGRLVPCGAAPNCVASQAGDPAHSVAPLEFTGSPTEAFKRLEQILAAMPRTRIVMQTAGYLHAECTTRLFRFIDDVEFLLDEPASVIHLRSASRLGYSDLGVNRRRVETVRRLFQTAQLR